MIFTILVLDVHFRTDEEEIPIWLHRLTFKFLVRAACWKNHCCCKRSKKSSVSPVLVTENRTLPISSKEKNALAESSNMADTVPENDDDGDNLDWKTLALILDKFFFVLHLSLIIVFTVVLWLVFGIHFWTSG